MDPTPILRELHAQRWRLRSTGHRLRSTSVVHRDRPRASLTQNRLPLLRAGRTTHSEAPGLLGPPQRREDQLRRAGQSALAFKIRPPYELLTTLQAGTDEDCGKLGQTTLMEPGRSKHRTVTEWRLGLCAGNVPQARSHRRLTRQEVHGMPHRTNRCACLLRDRFSRSGTSTGSSRNGAHLTDYITIPPKTLST